VTCHAGRLSLLYGEMLTVMGLGVMGMQSKRTREASTCSPTTHFDLSALATSTSFQARLAAYSLRGSNPPLLTGICMRGEGQMIGSKYSLAALFETCWISCMAADGPACAACQRGGCDLVRDGMTRRHSVMCGEIPGRHLLFCVGLDTRIYLSLS